MSATMTLDDALVRLERTLGRRHGIVLAPTLVPRTPADPKNVRHASVAREEDAASGSAGGGVGDTPELARVAAIAEALERYAASVVDIPTSAWHMIGPQHRLGFDDFTLHTTEQQADPLLATVGYGSHPQLAEMWRLSDGRATHVPAALVGLTTDHGTMSTSSGLAAGFSLEQAMLRGVEELIERDAFMSTWLHQIPGRDVAFEPQATDVAEMGGWLRAYDLTPAWSPHPVAAVLGMVPLEGEPRCSMGLACRGRWTDAVIKAEQECLQGTVFAGYEVRREPRHRQLEPHEVSDFDRHAVYYSARPERFNPLPIFRGTATAPPAGVPAGTSVSEQLRGLVAVLADAGIDIYGRELTTIDLHQIGLRVVRVLAPSLTPIHHDHRLPFLGGTTADRAWRYPDLEPLGTFPSPYPHPLG